VDTTAIGAGTVIGTLHFMDSVVGDTTHVVIIIMGTVDIMDTDILTMGIMDTETITVTVDIMVGDVDTVMAAVGITVVDTTERAPHTMKMTDVIKHTLAETLVQEEI